MPYQYRWDIVRMDRELKVPFSETLNEIYLEIPKFVLPISACDTFYKKWLYVLNNIEIMERLPEELNNQIFRKLKSIAEVERMTPDQRLIAANFKKQKVNIEVMPNVPVCRLKR